MAHRTEGINVVEAELRPQPLTSLPSQACPQASEPLGESLRTGVEYHIGGGLIRGIRL